MKVINNKLPQFRTSLYSVLDDAFRETARDILIKAKGKAPFDKGGLRGETDITRPGALHYRVSFWKEYARFQEFGGTSDKRVKNYTTSGTGKGFLKSSGDEQTKKLIMTIKKHTPRARA